MAAPTIYRSSDASAPTLSGTSGDLITVLNACLVTGYGSKTAAGWSKPYTATNGAVYRQGGGGQFYWQVDDNAPGAAGAQEARTRGYEVMTAWNTGTGLFPTAAQLAAGIIVRKSAAASATTRGWVVAADNATCYVFILSGDTAGSYLGTMFGDIYSYIVGDSYKCMVIGRDAENSASAITNENLRAIWMALNSTSAQVGHYVARSYTAFAGSVACAKAGDRTFQYNLVSGGENTGMVGSIPFPNPADGGLYISPLRIKEGASNAFTALRGELRGMYHQCHPLASFSDGDTFDGQGAYSGKSFTFLKQNGTTTVNAGIYTLQTTEWSSSP